MYKCIKRIICLTIIGLILFIAITFWGNGGDKFRLLGEKTGGIVKKISDKLADKADEYNEKAEDYIKKKKEGLFNDKEVKKDK